MSYTFTVKASNAIGESSPSNASASVMGPIQFYAPGAPVMISASISSGQPPVVNFSAPVDTGSGIFRYEVLASSGGMQFTATGTSSPISASALMPMTTYTFTVRACGIGGCGPYSDASNSVFVPLPVPGKPTIGTATAVSLGADVAFSTSGALGYYVETIPGGVTTHMGATSPIRINGLTDGVSYTFRVRGFNIGGSGEWSDVSNSVIPLP